MTVRDRIVVLVVAVLVLCAGGFFALVKPQREEAAKLGDQVAQERTRLQGAQAAAASAEQARRGYRTDYATVARLGKAIPADADVASLVYQLEAGAERFDIDFRGVTSSGQAAQAAAAAPPVAQAAQAGSDAKGKPADGKTDAGAPASQAAAAAAPAGTPVGTAGLPTMPFTFTFQGSYTSMRRFLGSLDDLTVARKDGLVIRGRLLTVDGVSLKAPEDPLKFPMVRAEIKATAYLVPPTEGLTAGATPQAPGTPAAAPAATGPSTPAPPTAAVTGGLR